jgi:hypothetical protein
MSNCITVFEAIQRLLPAKILEELANSKDSAHGNEKFSLERHLYTLLYAQLKEKDDLRPIAASLKADRHLQKYTGTISYSQLSRVNAERDSDFFKRTFEAVYAKLMSSSASVGLPFDYGRLKVLDSTAIKLCLTLFPWAEYRKNSGAIKIHTLFDAIKGSPESIMLTPGIKHDRISMEKLITEPGVTYLFDRAYLDHELWDSYCEKGILFVSRLKSNAVFEVLEEYQVKQGGKILTHKKVILGSTNARMSNPVWLVEVIDSSNGEAFHIVTNRFDLSPEQIADVYRLRWSIELFFKWIKQHLKIKKFYGTSRNAVLIQIYSALILFCLLKLIHNTFCKKSNFTFMVRLIADGLWNTVEYLTQCLTPTKPPSTGKPKLVDWKPLYKLILEEYEETDPFI